MPALKVNLCADNYFLSKFCSDASNYYVRPQSRSVRDLSRRNGFVKEIESFTFLEFNQFFSFFEFLEIISGIESFNEKISKNIKI